MFFYTYSITHKPSQLRYYGVRKSKRAPYLDLWKKYFTSSKRVKQLILQDGKEAFEYKVRKIFKSFDEAQDWEAKVLRRLKVTKRTDWLNYNIRGSKFKVLGPRDPAIMKKVHEKQKQKYGDYAFRQYHALEKQADTWQRLYGTTEFSKVGSMAFKQQTGYDNIRHIKGTCPHCDKIGQLVALKRWHFDNCKHKKS